MKATLIAGCVFLAGFVILSTPIFGEANSFGIAMFVALFLWLPAGVILLLHLLGQLARPRPRPALGVATPNQGSASGTCPNCEACINVFSTECPHCGAQFGEHASWKVLP